ncbi:MAG: hypothetical protein D6766_07535 [Verrucomicrobia bacterium]|nr:MAG: hypothetical protein D6766_07535 [Verrucomicrobiota bacterium]
MEWQQVVALAIVAVTASLMIWARLNGRRRGCGCGACERLVRIEEPARRPRRPVGPRLEERPSRGQRPMMRERTS